MATSAEVKKFFEDTCCVCQVDKTTHMFVPCGHKNICKTCALVYLDNTDSNRFQKCPLCQTKFEDITRFDGLELYQGQEDYVLKKTIALSLKETKKQLLSQLTSLDPGNPRRLAKQVHGLRHMSSSMSSLNPLTRSNARAQLAMDPGRNNSSAPNQSDARNIHKTKSSVANNIFSSIQNKAANNTGQRNNQSRLPDPILPRMQSMSLSTSNPFHKGNITVVFTETVNARFTSSDSTEGEANLFGKITFNIQQSDVSHIIESCNKKKQYKFQLISIGKLQELTVNDDFIKWLPHEMIGDGYEYEVDVKKMVNSLKNKVKERPKDVFYPLEAFTYKINTLDQMNSCPLLLSSKWTSNNSATMLKLKYAYNPASMSNANPLTDVVISVVMDIGFDNQMSIPVAHEIIPKENKVSWKLDSMSAARKSGTITSHFELNKRAIPFGTVHAKFRSKSNTLSGIRFNSVSFPLREVITRVFSGPGKYLCGETS